VSLFKKSLFSLSLILGLVGCGGGSGTCCGGDTPKLEDKISETGKVVEVPQEKDGVIEYVDRNITVIEYRDRNVTVIEYKDRNITVDVIKVRPVAAIDGIENGAILRGDFLSVDGNSSDDIDGNVVAYQWVLDDENISTEKNVTITLPKEEGVHTLCLIVKDNDKLGSIETCKTFTIPHKNQNPTAVITQPSSDIKILCPTTFMASNSISVDGTLDSYGWSIDDNQTFNGAEQNLSFSTLGEHKVCLTVTDSNSLTDTQCIDITVLDHEAPTLVMQMKDTEENIIIKETNLTRGARYDFSCVGSVDDCGHDISSSCEWNAHSYRIVDGVKVDYINDCISHGRAPKVGSSSWVQLCEAGSDMFDYVEITLKATDMFGKTTNSIYVYGVNP